MNWILKALLTGATVALVMWTARHGGRRMAGTLAGLPIVTAPTLLWVAHDVDASAAASAAVGSVAACAMLAAFALLYTLVARRAGAAVALCAGLLGACAMTLPAWLSSAFLPAAVALAVGCAGVALVLMRSPPGETTSPQRAGASVLATAGLAGTLTALAATLGPLLGGFATGLLASLPIISGAVVMVEHAAGGQHAAATFLRGYVWGLLGKAAFGAVFALAIAPFGVATALLLATGVALLATAARPRTPVSWRRWTTADDRP